MTDIQMIALNKLDRDPKNVRKNYRADVVAEGRRFRQGHRVDEKGGSRRIRRASD